MLITREAIDAIKTLSHTSDDGLRIAAVPPSQNGHGPSLALEPAAGPEPTDTVIEAEGAHIYVEPAAVDVLEGKVLDADQEPDGIRFAVFDAA